MTFWITCSKIRYFEDKMAILLNGLNRNIQDVVELQSCNNMDELIHSVMKLEQQLNRKQTYKKTSYTCSSWKDKDTSKKEGSYSQHLERKSSRGNPTSPTQLPNASCFLSSQHFIPLWDSFLCLPQSYWMTFQLIVWLVGPPGSQGSSMLTQCFCDLTWSPE